MDRDPGEVGTGLPAPVDAGRGPWPGRLLARWGFGIAGFLLVLAASLLALPPAGIERLDPAATGSLRITDAGGRLLRDAPVRGARGVWVRLSDLPPWAPAALLAAEDRRFYVHPGVDPAAVVRALLANARSGRIVSGGSTITQQAVRLLRDEPRRRSLRAKAGEMLDALRLECRLPKRAILEFYVNRLAFGRGAVGIEAASRRYFGHAAATLSPAEAAYLAVLPRSPGVYGRPEGAERLEKRRLALVATLRRSGRLDPEARVAAQGPPEVLGGAAFPFDAPHLTGWLLDQLPAELRGRAGTLRTTIDGSLQEEVEDVVRTQVARLSERGARQAAVVVIDNTTGRLLAMVGSADFFDEAAGGQVNGALARRQPGSALKPFTYALAFEREFTPASVVADVPSTFPATGGPFVPRNYGGTTFGPVRLREALGSSLNIAAVELLSRVGTNRLYALLCSLHLASPDGNPDLYGLGLTLGVGEVRLLDLAAAYGTFASGGMYREPAALLEARDPRGAILRVAPPVPPVRLVDPVAAWWITDILGDDAARYRSFGRGGVLDMPWPVAAKTGTSSDWRDNWAVGFTRERTVAVWVGDFSGEPMQRVSGVYGAAPILREVFRALARRGPLTRPPRPEGLRAVTVCSLSGALAGPDCPGRLVERFPPERVPEDLCRFHGTAPAGAAAEPPVRLPAEYQAWARDRGWEVGASPDTPGRSALRILHPGDDEVYFLDPALPPESQVLVFEAESPRPGASVAWALDAVPLGTTTGRHRVSWALRSGTHELRVSDGENRVAVRFRVQGISPREKKGASGKAR